MFDLMLFSGIFALLSVYTLTEVVKSRKHWQRCLQVGLWGTYIGCIFYFLTPKELLLLMFTVSFGWCVVLFVVGVIISTPIYIKDNT